MFSCLVKYPLLHLNASLLPDTVEIQGSTFHSCSSREFCHLPLTLSSLNRWSACSKRAELLESASFLLHFCALELSQSPCLLVFLLQSLFSPGASCANESIGAFRSWWKIWGSSYQPVQLSSLLCTTHITCFLFLSCFQPMWDHWGPAIHNSCYMGQTHCILLQVYKARLM